MLINTRVMTTKLTLTIEKSTIEKAKDYARKTGRSLSDLIESYLDSVTKSNLEDDITNMPQKLKKLYGVVNFPKDLDHKKEIRKILSSKNSL